MKNPRLWFYQKQRDYVEYLAHIAKYEIDVCGYCPKTICEDFDDLEECYQNYIEKSKEGDD